jgi:hypothetical protein
MTATLPPAAQLTDQAAAYRRAAGAEGTHLLVVLTDGSQFVVRRTNRDLIAWDRRRMHVKYGPAGDSPFVFAAFLAWSAAHREELFTGPFDGPGGFLDAADDLSPLVLAGDEDGEADGQARPTRPAALPG